MEEYLSDLYQEIILSHNKRPRNQGVLEPFDGKAEGFNPTCGDQVTIYLSRDGENRIEEVTFAGEGCAISQASASIMTDLVKGMNPKEVAEEIERVMLLLTGSAEPEVDLAEDGELAALAGVRKFPARVKCATLAWHALEEALNGGSTFVEE